MKILDHLKSEWFRYGFETLAVVVGILMAFALDRWNDTRQERILEKEYLTSIAGELQDNIQEALFQKGFSEFQQKNGELILHLLADTIGINNADLAIAIEHIGWNHKLNYIRDVWDELYATGNIEIITNQDLKNRLSKLYRSMEASRKFEELEWMNYNLGIRRIIGEILPPEIRLYISSHLTPIAYSGGVGIKLPSTGDMLEGLKKLEGLNGYLSDIIMARKASQSFLSAEIEEMREIIDLLVDELNR